MKKVLAAALIILFFPAPGVAQDLPQLGVNPGKLPHQFGYLWQNAEEWLSVNLFTLSTTGKQRKLLALSSKRVAEISLIAKETDPSLADLRTVASRYEDLLGRSEDMAEKILILDGVQLPLAEKFEQTSRLQEQMLLSLLQTSGKNAYPLLLLAANTARIENELMFKYMVSNYQFNQSDIAKYGQIVSQQASFLQKFFSGLPEPLSGAKQSELTNSYVELSKAEAAGLNAQAYDSLRQATDIILNHLRPR